MTLVEVDAIEKLPKVFEAYTASSTIAEIVTHFKKKYAYEPDILYNLSIGKMKMIAVEVKQIKQDD